MNEVTPGGWSVSDGSAAVPTQTQEVKYAVSDVTLRPGWHCTHIAHTPLRDDMSFRKGQESCQPIYYVTQQ